jgi:hypothetical protein
MAYTANTILSGKPASFEVHDAGNVTFASGGKTWELNAELQPDSFTRADGAKMKFSRVNAGKAIASVTFGNDELPASEVSVENSASLASFVAVLNALESAATTPGFPDAVKAKLNNGFKALGVDKGIGKA